MPHNPFQDKINALNLKDIDEGLITQSYLKQSHEPIQLTQDNNSTPTSKQTNQPTNQPSNIHTHIANLSPQPAI